MTIDEAIKVIEVAISFAHFPSHAPQEDALKLGIEALKRVKTLREIGSMSSGILLPGETEK